MAIRLNVLISGTCGTGGTPSWLLVYRRPTVKMDGEAGGTFQRYLVYIFTISFNLFSIVDLHF